MTNYDAIPDELKSYDNWVVWRFEWPLGPNSKPTKVLYDPRTGNKASHADPRTWCSFAQCRSAVEANIGYDGVGFVFSENDPYCGVDLDEVDAEATEDFERQKAVYEYLNSYSEISPSGKGLHVIVKASVPHGRKRSSIEVYSSLRFFTMTGHVYRNAPIADRQNEIQSIWAEMGSQAQPSHYAGDLLQRSSDEEIFDKAANAANGELFLRLWNGDWSGYPPNNAGTASSEADFALVDIIAFYTKNRMQIQRMFLASALGKRDKYKRLNLLGYMIDKSFDRMLPEVDLSGAIDKVNEALRGRGAQQGPAPASPVVSSNFDHAAPVLTPSQTQSYTYDGFDLTTWKRETPPGLLGEIAQFVFQAAPRPVYEIALAASIGLMAGIAGRAFNVSGTGLNLYVMLLAATGTGKEAIQMGIDRLIDTVARRAPTARDFIGPGRISSGQALLKHLGDRPTPSFVSITGEIGLRLQQMSGPYANDAEKTLRAVLLDLFNKSGAGQSIKPTIYSDKKNNTDEVYSPAFSMLGESVPSEFYKAFDESAIAGGLLPRFIMIEYQGERVRSNYQAADAKPSDFLVNKMDELIMSIHNRMQHGDVVTVQCDNQAFDMLRTLDRYADDRINHSNADVLKQLWNRLHIKVYKLAALLAVGVNFYQPLITAKMVDWATSLVLSDIVNLTHKFERGEVGSNNEITEQELSLKKAFRDFFEREAYQLSSYSVRPDQHAAKVVSKTYLTMKARNAACFRNDRKGATVALDIAIKDLTARGVIQEMPRQQVEQQFNGFRGMSFIVNDVGWVFN